MAEVPLDAIVIGTGFGGAVTACRLVEAGFRICVLERGRRYGPNDFPRYPAEELFVHEDSAGETPGPPPDFSRWLWSSDYGIYDIEDLGDAVAVQAAGYGGGSLIYANVHIRPPEEVFTSGWPEPYASQRGTDWELTPFFDLAAYMLGATLIPKRLAKTLQLQRAADALAPNAKGANWFRVPLAVSFEGAGADQGERSADQTENVAGSSARSGKDDSFTNAFNRQQRYCDMRGRCWMGCDRQAKNTLDLNYLARAEDGGKYPADVRTMSEVIRIDRNKDGTFDVTYKDLLFRDSQNNGHTHNVHAKFVFLCAGSVGTTKLLLGNQHLMPSRAKDKGTLGRPAGEGPLGSHYFTNSGSLAAVFDCDQPHEADYGPTITSALVVHRAAEDRYSRSLDFTQGKCVMPSAPVVGMKVRKDSRVVGVLAHDPLLDWGDWKQGTAVGSLVLTDTNVNVEVQKGETLQIGEDATVEARSSVISHGHWFMVQDGGYPPSVEPLVGLFRSPLWARRNRFLEVGKVPPSFAPPGRKLRVQTFADAMSGIPTADLLEEQVRELLPPWFVEALDTNRQELLGQAGAAFLPVLGRLLDELSVTLVDQVNPEMLERLNVGVIGGVKKEVLVRGMLRQGLQVLAGSEVALADKVAQVVTSNLPLSPEQVLRALGSIALWALAYGTGGRDTGLMLTMGRDTYRGKLELVPGKGRFRPSVLTAKLPVDVERPAAALQERVLRAIARDGWTGELRTNPAWAPLEKHLTVHSQGGCPMGTDPEHSVTDPWGEVHRCPGLYVMDAAAFPTSVGVNPSATIAAVAELKIQHFICGQHDKGWETPDKEQAVAWVTKQGRDDLDPLRRGTPANAEPLTEVDVIGFEFEETMEGFLSPLAHDEPPTNSDNLAGLLRTLEAFEVAEDEGMRQSLNIRADLKVGVVDLAELISPARTNDPVKIPLTGTVEFRARRDEDPTKLETSVSGGSFLQMFVPPPPDTEKALYSGGDPTVRFFRYELRLTDKEERDKYTLKGLKVLRNQRGHDVWNDTATLFFEIEGDSLVRRGILRLSLAQFARHQLPSMTITGTTDAARQSWALAAFSRYFARGLTDLYATRTDQLVDLLKKTVTAIHV